MRHLSVGYVHAFFYIRPPPTHTAPLCAPMGGGGGGRSGQFQSGCRAVTGHVKAVGGGGYWRLEMRLGLALGYGKPLGWSQGRSVGVGGGTPPPFKRFPWGGGGGPANRGSVAPAPSMTSLLRWRRRGRFANGARAQPIAVDEAQIEGGLGAVGPEPGPLPFGGEEDVVRRVPRRQLRRQLADVGRVPRGFGQREAVVDLVDQECEVAVLLGVDPRVDVRDDLRWG